MPIITRNDSEVIGPRPVAPLPSSTDPSLGEVFSTTFDNENTIANIARSIVRPQFEPVQDYDAFENIQGYEQYAESFISSNSPQETARIKNDIDRENKNRSVLMSGTFTENLLAGIATGATDPISYIPIGGELWKTYRTTGHILEGAARTALNGLASQTSAEAILQEMQYTRTGEESAYNIAAVTFLSGIMGGTVGTFRKGPADEFDTLIKGLEADMRIPVSSSKWAKELDFAALEKQYNLPRGLLEALMMQESGGNPNAVSPAGAQGLFQFMPDTAKQFKIDPLDPAQSATGAAQYMRQLLDMFDGDIEQALAGYNAGPGNVRKHGGIPPFKETQNYVKSILSRLNKQDPSQLSLFDEGAIPVSARQLEADTNPSVGAMSSAPTRAELKLKSALGMVKVLAFSNPIMRSLTSRSLKTRRAAQELVRSNLTYEGNALGLKSPVAVETRIEAWDAPLADAITTLDQAFVQYRGAQGGTAKRTMIGIQDTFSKPEKMTYKQFREEVGKAMRRGDVHQVPEVQRAAETFRNKLFDPTKERAIALKLLPEDVNVDETALSYLTRVYNNQKIIARRNEFKAILQNWLKRTDERGLDDIYHDRTADQIIDHILGTPDGRLPYDMDINDIQGSRKSGGKKGAESGQFKARSLLIPDEEIEEFLESDIDLIARLYKGSVVPDIEIAGRFDDVQMTAAVKEIQDEYNDIISKATSEKMRKALQKEKEQAIEDIAAMRDRLRGTYAMPANPKAWGHRAMRLSRQANLLSKLGGRLLSSFPDIGRPVMQEGLTKVLNHGLKPLITNAKTFKVSMKEAKELGAITDFILNTRTHTFGETMNMYGRHSKLERALNGMTDTFGLATLGAPWDQFMKEFSGAVTMHRVLTETANWSKGKISKKNIERLAASGIDATLAQDIAAQFEKHGVTENGVKIANWSQWDSPQAIQAMRDLMTKETRNSVVTPGVGDRPLWVSSELGKTISQFKSFNMAAAQTVLLSGLQRRDAATLNGAMISVTAGMFSYYLYSMASGRELSDNPAKWVTEGIDRSGLTGWFFDVNNIVEKASRGNIGVSALTGNEPMSRYQSRNVTGALLGPTFGQMQDIFQLTGAAASGEWTASDTHAVRRLLPYQNLFYLRQLLDEAEQGVNDFFGVE